MPLCIAGVYEAYVSVVMGYKIIQYWHYESYCTNTLIIPLLICCSKYSLRMGTLKCLNYFENNNVVKFYYSLKQLFF